MLLYFSVAHSAWNLVEKCKFSKLMFVKLICGNYLWENIEFFFN